MPLDHFLPATYIAGFSTDTNPVRRQRRVWVADKQAGKIFETAASNVCAINDFYTLETSQFDAPRVVDAQFSYYEGPLANAIDHLISGVIDAHTWLTVLVRFVAGLLVRGPDFNRRFLRRFSDSFRAELAKLDPVFHGRDNTNLARIHEHQRLLAPICGAAWTVLETSGGVEQITNDLGFIGFEHVQTKYRGIAVPLDRHHILTLRPRLQAILAIARAGTWVPEIRFGKLSDEQHVAFTTTVGAAAQRFVFGPTDRAVTPHIIKQEMPPLVPDPADLGFLAGRRASVHEMLFFELLQKIGTPPHRPDPKIYIDFSEKIRKAEAAGRWVDI